MSFLAVCDEDNVALGPRQFVFRQDSQCTDQSKLLWALPPPHSLMYKMGATSLMLREAVLLDTHFSPLAIIHAYLVRGFSSIEGT